MMVWNYQYQTVNSSHAIDCTHTCTHMYTNKVWCSVFNLLQSTLVHMACVLVKCLVKGTTRLAQLAHRRYWITAIHSHSYTEIPEQETMYETEMIPRHSLATTQLFHTSCTAHMIHVNEMIGHWVHCNSARSLKYLWFDQQQQSLLAYWEVGLVIKNNWGAWDKLGTERWGIVRNRKLIEEDAWCICNLHHSVLRQPKSMMELVQWKSSLQC